MIVETVCTRGPKFKIWSQSRYFGGFARKRDGIYRWRWSLACTLASFSHANGSVQARRICTGAPRFHSCVKIAVFRRVCAPSWRQYSLHQSRQNLAAKITPWIPWYTLACGTWNWSAKVDAYGSPHITTLGQNRGASTVFAGKMKFRTDERTMVAVFSATLPLV